MSGGHGTAQAVPWPFFARLLGRLQQLHGNHFAVSTLRASTFESGVRRQVPVANVSSRDGVIRFRPQVSVPLPKNSHRKNNQ
jgi:hypothetical protein